MNMADRWRIERDSFSKLVRAIRAEVGRDFHLQMKISAIEHNEDLSVVGGHPGNTLEDSIKVCQWLEEAGVDAIHVSTGSSFPHPRNPAGDFPLADAAKTFDTMISSGSHTLRNYLLFRTPLLGPLFRDRWVGTHNFQIEGMNLPASQAIKQAVQIPVLCTGGFQTASVIRAAISGGQCDGVTIARPLVANNDLVQMFMAGKDVADKPCTYCNKCLVNVLENPLGCYEQSRFASHEEMVAQIMSVFDPAPFSEKRSAAP